MNIEVKSLTDARDFFINNSAGSVTCNNGKTEKECFSYQEALEFYNE